MKDVRPLKQRLREERLRARDGIDPERRAQMDRAIAENLFRLRSFETCRALLTYVSFGSEISTIPIIEYCLSHGKPVAVPKCEGRRRMDFYFIRSLGDLSPGRSSILEPDPGRCELLTSTVDTLCLVPALCFDRSGNRLGYGGGYYDSFISDHPGTHLGLCYTENIVRAVPTCRHDVRYDSILTEKGIILCRK